jgi:hypothetical protein
MSKYLKDLLVIISLCCLCCSCATTANNANKLNSDASGQNHKKTIVGGITGATLGIAAGAGIAAACAFPPAAIVIAPIAIIGLGTAGGAGGAYLGHHLDKSDSIVQDQ